MHQQIISDFALPASATGGRNKFVLGTVIFSLSLYTADCCPVRNIVVLLAWSASQYSLFLPAQALPASATGGGKYSFSVR